MPGRQTPSRESVLLTLRFLAGGVFNAGTCVALSQLAFLALGDAVVAFVVGYAASLTLSYFVNAVLVFRADRLSVAGFVTFCVSYVPNFLIQFVLVGAMTRWLGVVPWLAYALGVAIGVPVTFVILSRFTFRERARAGDAAVREPASLTTP